MRRQAIAEKGSYIGLCNEGYVEKQGLILRLGTMGYREGNRVKNSAVDASDMIFLHPELVSSPMNCITRSLF